MARPRELDFLAHFLFILAAWTLVIKFIFPVSVAIARDVPLTTYVMWDFWWVVHIALGCSLLAWKSYTYWFAMWTSIIEIAIIVFKFVLFSAAPEFTVWRINWFVNKIFVLICFALLFVTLIRNASQLKRMSDE